MAINELDYIKWISLICTLQSMETFFDLVRARNKNGCFKYLRLKSLLMACVVAKG